MTENESEYQRAFRTGYEAGYEDAHKDAHAWLSVEAEYFKKRGYDPFARGDGMHRAFLAHLEGRALAKGS